MIPVNELISVFKTIIGWPYASPGSNSAAGIDCSGAFVYAYRQFGESIYHGSNRIVRVYCYQVKPVTTLSQLEPGMAIFKSRKTIDKMKAEYKPGGRYYDPQLPDDFYHIGLVTGVSPLQIVNATTPRARVDTDLSRWHWAGYLKAVEYDEPNVPDSPQPEAPTPEDSPDPFQATVTALSGSTVNLRKCPEKGADILERVPLGQTLTVLASADPQWYLVQRGQQYGFMMKEFLARQDG